MFTEPSLMSTADNIRKYYGEEKNGGLSPAHTGSLYAFLDTVPGDKLKLICEVGGNTPFAFPTHHTDMDGIRAIYHFLQQAFGKSEWKNQEPSWAKNPYG